MSGLYAAGDTVSTTVYRQDSDGAAVTGKTTTGDWSLRYTIDGSAQTFTPTIAEGATVGPSGNQWREYTFTFTMPNTAGDHSVVILADSDDEVVHRNNPIAGKVEQYDIDFLASVVAKPVVTLTDAGGPSADVNIRVPKGDYAEIVLGVQDQAGNAIPLATNGWNNPRFGVRSDDGTTTDEQITSGITLADGSATVVIPETFAGYSALATGVSSVKLHYTLVADEGADTAKTRTIARGSFTIIRREVDAP